MINKAKLINNIIESLNQLVDLNRIEFTQKNCPTAMQIMGVSVPDMRKVLKELKRDLSDVTAREKLEVAKSLVQATIIERQLMAYDLIRNDKRIMNEFELDDLEAFDKNLDNWASVDCFSLFLTGHLWRTGKVDIKWIKK